MKVGWHTKKPSNMFFFEGSDNFFWVKLIHNFCVPSKKNRCQSKNHASTVAHWGNCQKSIIRRITSILNCHAKQLQNSGAIRHQHTFWLTCGSGSIGYGKDIPFLDNGKVADGLGLINPFFQFVIYCNYCSNGFEMNVP